MQQSEIICLCGYVTREEIEDAVDLGLNFEELQKQMDVCIGCTSCMFKVIDIINQINNVNT